MFQPLRCEMLSVSSLSMLTFILLLVINIIVHMFMHPYISSIVRVRNYLKSLNGNGKHISYLMWFPLPVRLYKDGTVFTPHEELPITDKAIDRYLSI